MDTEYIVVSDLDGTLLDHHSYDWREASPALELLRLKQIPVVLCSSKTIAEIMPIREALGLSAPFIVENGGAVYLPEPGQDTKNLDKVEFGMNRAEILERLDVLATAPDMKNLGFTGFSEMTVADVINVTGLDPANAANALQREYTEPLLWQDSEESKQRFLKQVRKAGLDAVEGGRFLHISAGCNKGKAVNYLRKFYEKRKGVTHKLIALGDSENDISMLELADLPVLVRSPVKDFPRIRHDRVYRTTALGPAGWNEAILKLLKQEDIE